MVPCPPAAAFLSGYGYRHPYKKATLRSSAAAWHLECYWAALRYLYPKCPFMIPAYAFKQSVTVQPHHLDDLNHVNNIVYLQWIQDVSAAHWFHWAGTDVTNKWVWMVKRHEIDYLRQAFLGDVLELFTWPEAMEKSTSVRHVLIRNKTTGKDIMRSRTTWALIDAQSGKTSVPDEELKGLFDALFSGKI